MQKTLGLLLIVLLQSGFIFGQLQIESTRNDGTTSVKRITSNKRTQVKFFLDKNKETTGIKPNYLKGYVTNQTTESLTIKTRQGTYSLGEDNSLDFKLRRDTLIKISKSDLISLAFQKDYYKKNIARDISSTVGLVGLISMVFFSPLLAINTREKTFNKYKFWQAELFSMGVCVTGITLSSIFGKKNRIFYKIPTNGKVGDCYYKLL